MTKLEKPARSTRGRTGGDRSEIRPVIREVPALTKGIAILRLLAGSETPLGIHEVARELGLVPSTCLHILRALAAERFVAADPETKKYSVTYGLVALAQMALRHSAFPSVVQPELDELSAAYKAMAIAVEASDLDHMVVVALARTPSPLQLQVEIGSRFPTLISATGRCVAAFGNYAKADIKARFQKLQWDSPPTFAEWQAEVRAAREAGFAIDDGRYIRGISIVAAPIRMPNDVVNALVLVGFSEQMRELGPSRIGADLRDRALRLSDLLRNSQLTTRV